MSGRSTWIRTREWRHQKPLPYRLAIDLQMTALLSYFLSVRLEKKLDGAEGETRTLTPLGART